MIDFIWLIFAHYIGDTALQSYWQAVNKGKNLYIMFCHCMVWTACICIALQSLFIDITYFKLLFLLIGHFIIDYKKCKLPINVRKSNNIMLLDQSLHLLQCFIVWKF